MKKNGKKKRLISIAAILCMLLQMFSAMGVVYAAEANEIEISATAMANGVKLSWSAEDFGNADTYTVYRDGLPIATVESGAANTIVSGSTYTYNDVYFQTIEQMRGEVAGADIVATKGTDDVYAYTDYTYYVKAGNSTSTSVTSKPDLTKIAYFTFDRAIGYSSAPEVNGASEWSGVKNDGLEYNGTHIFNATKGTTSYSTTLDTKTFSTKYTANETSGDKTISNKGFAYAGEINDKKAGGLVGVKVAGQEKYYGSKFSLTLKSSKFTNTESSDYIFWINAALETSKYIPNTCFGIITSGTGEIVTDKEGANIAPSTWYGNNLTNSSFSFVTDSSLAGQDRYATYKFKYNGVLNNTSAGNRTLSFTANVESSGVTKNNAEFYNADGEMAAIHSVAVIASNDVLSGSVEDVLKVLPYEIEGVKVTKDGSTSNNLVSGGTITGISVTRYTEAADPVTVILALYESGKLVETKIETVTPAMAQYASGDLTLTTGSLTLPTLTTNHTARIFLLKNTSTLVPVAESYPVPVQSLY